jgi:threonine aldolase
MDGARLFNAEVALGVPAAAQAEAFDTVWIDLSKGLGCPIGGVLAGSAEFVAAAWRWKQRMGGAMRQAGIVAAAGLYALEHHVERLAEDHANAQVLADRIGGLAGIDVDQERVQTNMVFFDVAGTGRSAAEIASHLGERGVLVGAVSGTEIRAVTHLDVTADQVEQAAAELRGVLAGS